MVALMDMAKGLAFKNKKAAAFGTYGWSGESVQLLTARLKDAGFQVVNDGIREAWNPDSDGLARCQQFGQQFVGQL